MEGKRLVYAIISENLKLFHKLERAGVRTISSAVDYILIFETYQKYDWIQSKEERKATVASQCQVSISTVNTAIRVMTTEIDI
ncbi:hypothetical protein [Elizabethkingia phage TCUEAP1]|nr:hypothetical protein [Elizabethkingia phage TCUEAP1]